MNNPETLETLGAHDTRRREKTNPNKHNTTQKTKKMINTDPSKNRGWAKVLVKGKQLSFVCNINHILDYMHKWFKFL